jgi:hypothetical protein
MKVCVWVCVCVCVSGGLPPGPHKPSPQNLAWAPHFTRARHRARGRPQMLPPRGKPHSDRLKNPEGYRIGRGPANKSCSSGWVCLVKFYLWGAHPNPKPAGSTLPGGGVCIYNCAGASKQKWLLWVGLPGKILFWGASPNLEPAGSTPPNGGVCFENFAGASQ